MLETEIKEICPQVVFAKFGTMNISGVSEGASIAVYSSSGMMVGSAKASGSSNYINTELRNGEIAIVKIGDKSIKVVMK